MQEVEAVCLKIRNLMRIEPDLGPRETFAVELLAREALSNAVRHGCREDARLKVRCRFRLGRLRAILEEVLLEVMYDLPSRTDISKCVVDRAVVLDKVHPTLVPVVPAKATRSRRAAS